MRGDKPPSTAQCIPTPFPLLVVVGRRRSTQATSTIFRTGSSHRVCLPIAALVCAVLLLHLWHDEAAAAAAPKPKSDSRTGKLANRSGAMTMETPLTVVHKFVYSNERICGDIFGDGKWLPAKHRCRLDCRLGAEFCQMRSTTVVAAAKDQRCLRLPEECQRRLKALLDDFRAKNAIDPFTNFQTSVENVDASTENIVTPTTAMPSPPFMRKSSGNFVAPPPSGVASGRRGGQSLPTSFSSIQERRRPYDKLVGGGKRPLSYFDNTAGQLPDAVRQKIVKFDASLGITPMPPIHQRQSVGPPAPSRSPDGVPPSSSSIPTLPPPQIPPHLTAKPVSTLDVVNVEQAQSPPPSTDESVELVPFSTDGVLLPLPEVVLSGASTFPPPRPSTTPPAAFLPSSVEIRRTTLPLEPVSLSSESKSLTQTFVRLGNAGDRTSSTATARFTSAWPWNRATTKRSTEHLVTEAAAATSPLPFDVDAALEHNYHATNESFSVANTNHRTPLRIYSTVWSVRPASTTTPMPKPTDAINSSGASLPFTTTTIDSTTLAAIDDSDSANFFAGIDANNIFGIEQNPFKNIDDKQQQQQQQQLRQKTFGTSTTILASLPAEITVTTPTVTLLHSSPNTASNEVPTTTTTANIYPMLPLMPKMTSFSWKMTSSSAEESPTHDAGNHIGDSSSPYALVDYSMEAQKRQQKHWRGARPPPYGNLGYYGTGSRGGGSGTAYGYSYATNNNEVSAELPSVEVLSPPSRRREYHGVVDGGGDGYNLVTSSYGSHHNNRDFGSASRVNEQTEEDVIHIFGPPINPASDASKIIMPSSAENGVINPSLLPYDPVPYTGEQRTADLLSQSYSPKTFNNNNGKPAVMDVEDSLLRKNDSFVMRSGVLDENSSVPQQQAPAQQHSQQLLNAVTQRRGNFLNSLQQVEFSTEKRDENLRKNIPWWATTSASDEMTTALQMMKSNFKKRPYYAQALILDQSVRCCQWALDGLCDRSWQRVRRLCPKSCGNVVCTSAEGTLSCNRVIDVNVIDCYAQRKQLKSFIANFSQQLSVEEAEHNKESVEKSRTSADDENQASEERSRSETTVSTKNIGIQQLSRKGSKKNGIELLSVAYKHYADTSSNMANTTTPVDTARREYAIEDEIRRFNLLNKKEKLTKSNF